MCDLQDGVLRLKRPANEGRESTALVLLVPQPPEMLDPVLDRFDMAEHHRGARFQTELVRRLHHFKPRVGIAFQRGDPVADPVDQNLPATPWKRAEACLFELCDYLPQRHPEKSDKMLELRWTETMDINVRILLADVPQELEIPVECQRRVMTALHQDLNPARGGKFIQFLVELFPAQDVMV